MMEISFFSILKLVWSKKRRVISVTIIFSLIGIGIGLVTPNRYEAGTTFIPQVSEDSQMGSLGGLAALTGINLNGLRSGSELSPKVYPNILESVPFKLEILRMKIILSGDSIEYRQYLSEKKLSTGKALMKYTIGLPGIILKSLRSEEAPAAKSFSEKNSIVEVSDDDFKLLDEIENNIKLNFNEMDGFVIVSVMDEDKFVAAQMALNIEQELQKVIISIRTKKTEALYEFTYEQWLEQKDRLYKIQDSLAIYLDSNRDVSSAYSLNRRMRLESEYDMSLKIYSELSTQKEELALQLEKETPVFTIIDPVNVPNEKSSPKRVLIAFVWAFMGFVFSVILILINDPWKFFKKEILSK